MVNRAGQAYSHELLSDRPSGSSSSQERVLVCGLGSLGQHCVVMLKEFGVSVSAIELNPPTDWEIPVIPELLDQLWIGDCCQANLLAKADVQSCRAILLATENERVNIETAFAARLLNPKVRLVARSSKRNLNKLLSQQLGNFVAFEPTQLSAPAFALAALDEKILGFFQVNDQLFQVVKHVIDPSHGWCNVRFLHELNTRTRRVLSYVPISSRMPAQQQMPLFRHFHQWESDARVSAGDVLITIEATQFSASPTHPGVDEETVGAWQKMLERLRRFNLKATLVWLWRGHDPQYQIRRVALVCGVTVLILLLTGTILFSMFYPEISPIDAFFATVVLLLGGYGDRFDDFGIEGQIPGWLRFFGLTLTLAGTAFVGVLYALLTEKLLTLRLHFLERRRPIPQRNHVVIIGMGRVGRRVVKLLQQLRQPVVGVIETPPEQTVLPDIPMVVGNFNTALAEVNLAQAQSVVAVTEDEMQNLELGLMVHAANPDSRMVIRTYDERFSDRVARLFPYAHVLCASALSAEAFVAAAFGENVLGLFRLDRQTILVTEYQIEAADTLHGMLLAEVAYGYRVVPLAYQKAGQDAPKLMPSDDLRLHGGDRLIVLATIEGLKRIEKGEAHPRTCQILVEKLLTSNAAFDGAAEIALIAGCSIETAHAALLNSPALLPVPMYQHQAQRLVRKLRKTQVMAQIRPFSGA